jgi:hypothetical protein
MLKPMFGHRPKPKKFDLPLRYYDPEKEKSRRQRIRIETHTRRPDGQAGRVMLYAALLFFVVWIIARL